MPPCFVSVGVGVQLETGWLLDPCTGPTFKTRPVEMNEQVRCELLTLLQTGPGRAEILRPGPICLTKFSAGPVDGPASAGLY